jgi:MFS superfamily sulfate permease-like transporter
MSFTALRLLKWLLGAGILALFFTLDALFLRVTGNGDLRTALLGVYAFVGTLMLVIAALAPGSAGYDVARELLGFLQSPLPSFMLVFVRWMLARMQQPRT